MKTLPKMAISDELDTQINESTKIADLCKADVIRQALRIGLEAESKAGLDDILQYPIHLRRRQL